VFPSCGLADETHNASEASNIINESEIICKKGLQQRLPSKDNYNISFHKVVPRILVCVPCSRSTFAHATLICTFLTN